MIVCVRVRSGPVWDLCNHSQPPDACIKTRGRHGKHFLLAFGSHTRLSPPHTRHIPVAGRVLLRGSLTTPTPRRRNGRSRIAHDPLQRRQLFWRSCPGLVPGYGGGGDVRGAACGLGEQRQQQGNGWKHRSLLCYCLKFLFRLNFSGSYVCASSLLFLTRRPSLTDLSYCPQPGHNLAREKAYSLLFNAWPPLFAGRPLQPLLMRQKG